MKDGLSVDTQDIILLYSFYIRKVVYTLSLKRLRPRMKLKILNRPLAGVFRGGEPYVLISIADPNQENLRRLVEDKNLRDVLFLHFYDNEMPFARGTEWEHGAFTRKHAERILDFTERWKNDVDMICVNCIAGVSRSPGAVAALSHVYNSPGSHTWLFDTYDPNMWVYRTIVEVASDRGLLTTDAISPRD
jgi:predicted protein tyrosine phosphatase